jgi:streptomycin 6-kinase
MTERFESPPIPASLLELHRHTRDGVAWLERLPKLVSELEERWSLTLETPFDGSDISTAWVAPVIRADGSSAVLKVVIPHMEGEHEIDGLRFWNGDPTVRLLDADKALGAILLERCEPGTTLRSLPEVEQDVVIAGLLRRSWRVPSAPNPFRPLSVMIDHWIEETLANQTRWPDPGLVREGLEVFEELARPRDEDNVLVATDLHAGNVLSAEREPWLVIDPKPFVGDSAYDATQHLVNCEGRMRGAPHDTIGRFADLLEVNADRVRLWMFARAAAEPRDEWTGPWMELARNLAP